MPPLPSSGTVTDTWRLSGAGPVARRRICFDRPKTRQNRVFYDQTKGPLQVLGIYDFIFCL